MHVMACNYMPITCHYMVHLLVTFKGHVTSMYYHVTIHVFSVLELCWISYVITWMTNPVTWFITHGITQDYMQYYMHYTGIEVTYSVTIWIRDQGFYLVYTRYIPGISHFKVFTWYIPGISRYIPGILRWS